jgi:Icc-related predicted phosphoesterase
MTTNFEMISTGYANMTPWNCPRDIPEDDLFKKIETMAARLEKPESAIFNLHCPPYASQLDDAPELDDNLTPVLIAGQIHIIPVGSTAVREAIEQWQPLAALHGHIHESRGRTDIGKTACFNPGSEYATGYLRGLILDLKKGKIKQYQLTSG